MRAAAYILAVFAWGIVSCNKETKYSNIPKIKFQSVSPAVVTAGSDSAVRVKFEFEDGDGNVGYNSNNVFFIDQRFPLDTIPFSIPVIPDRFNPDNGLKGIVQVDYEAAFLLLRPDSLHAERDTLRWDIYMKDKTGNISNLITTSDLILVK